MATRFYLPSSGSAPVSVSVTADWEHNNAVSRATKTWKTNTSIADTSYSPDGADDITNRDSMFVQFVSDPLLPQTISAQTLKYAIQGSETNNGNNCSMTLKAFLVSNDGGTVRGTILAIQRDGTELTTTVTNRIDSGTTSSISALYGDRIVFEIGIGGTPTAAGGVQGHNGAIRFGDNQSTDLPENDTDTGSTSNPWVEFANNLQFVGAAEALNTEPVEAAASKVTQARKTVLASTILAMACAYVPTATLPIAAVTADAGGSIDSSILLPPRQIQYQAVAAPVLVPQEVQAEVLISQWQPSYPDWVPGRINIPEGFTVNPAYVPDVTDPAPLLSWQPEYPDRAWDYARLDYLAPTSTGRIDPPAVQEVAADASAPSSTDILFRPYYVQYQAIAAPVLAIPEAEVITADKWLPEYPDRLDWLPTPEGLSVTPVYIPDVTDPAPPLSWASTYPDRLERIPTPEGHFVEPTYVPDVTDPAPPLSWKATYPDKIDRAPTPEGYFTEPAYVPDVTDPAPPLSWKAVYPDQINKAPTPEGYSVGSLFPIAEAAPAPELSWKPVYPDVLNRPVTVRNYFVAPIYVPDVTDPTPLLSWEPQYPDRTPGYPTFDYLSPASARSIEPPAPEVPVEADAGGFIGGDQIRPPRQIQYQALAAPVVAIPDAGAQAPTLIKAVYPDRIYRKHPLAVYTWGQQHFGVEVEIPVEAWEGTYPAQVVRVKRNTPATTMVAPLEPPAPPPPAPDLSWQPEYPDILLKPKSRIATNGYVTEVPSQLGDPPPPVVPELSWEPQYPDRLDRKGLHASYQTAWTADKFEPPVAPAGTADAAGPIGGDLVYRPRHIQYQSMTGPVATAPFVPPPAPELIRPTYPDRIYRKYPLAVYTWGQQHFGVEVEIPVESWESTYPAIAPKRVTKAQTVVVTPLLPPEPVPDLSWKPTYPDILLPRGPETQLVVVEPASSAVVQKTRGLISFTEFEIPLVQPTRGLVSFTEFEAPLVGTRGRISWVEFAFEEIPIAGNSPRIGYLMVQGYFADDEEF